MIDLHAPLIWGDDRPLPHDYLKISKRRIEECICAEWEIAEPFAEVRRGRIDWAAVLVYGGIGAYVAMVAWGIVKAVTR